MNNLSMLDEPAVFEDGPKLLVEWSSPWSEFKTAIGPALRRSPERLLAEAPVGLFPYRGLLFAWLIEGSLLVAAIILPAKLSSVRPYEPPPRPKYDIIYYSGDELPQTEDAGGSRAGHAGVSGGQRTHHETQVIRVVRGETAQEKVVDAPKLNLPRADSAVANLLAYKAIPGPAPTKGLQSSGRRSDMLISPVAPSPEVRRDDIAVRQTLNSAVVAPSPSLQREMALLHLPGNTSVQVIAPPVSAPERVTSLSPKLTLPAPSVVAPAPQLSREIAKSGQGFGPELSKQVIPPPTQVEKGTPYRTMAGLGSSAVVPPTVHMNDGSIRGQSMAGLGVPGVIAPSPTLANAISLSGSRNGNRATGLGNQEVKGPPASTASTKNATETGTGVVVSNQPGSKVGVPSSTAGAIAMSPTGTAKPGIGDSGNGTGINRGNAAGSGLTGQDHGAGKASDGRGSDTIARNGITPYSGTGGAGTGVAGKPAMPGVSVSGGTKSVTLPSFGADPSQPSAPGRSNTNKTEEGPGITIVATSRSGGAFNMYGTLKGDNYTIYIETALGTAVMQFADPNSAAHAYAGELVSPQAIRSDIPTNLHRSRLVFACVLDRAGTLKNVRVLEPSSAETTSKVMAALPSWKFRPAMRGKQPVEVDAILGFDIDTR
ncbi:MAG TPA: energy transducer TonB [Terriglobales bacterium]|nr:energy transducer TonB [Terriglobales bacterium]